MAVEHGPLASRRGQLHRLGGGRLVVGDTGYAGKPLARHHNTIVVGEFGQGMEKEHDAWEGMDRAALDRVRITEATLTPTSARLVADLAAAYPPGAGVTTLRREFSFDAPGRFRVRDHVETSEPRLAAWYLHADRPFTLDGTSFSDRDGDILDGRAALPRARACARDRRSSPRRASRARSSRAGRTSGASRS
jgi:hypothetical protein